MKDAKKVIESMTPAWFESINKRKLARHDQRTLNEACFDSGVMAASEFCKANDGPRRISVITDARSLFLQTAKTMTPATSSPTGLGNPSSAEQTERTPSQGAQAHARPILFSSAMVRAILEGRKTQTRRVVKDPEHYGCITGDCDHSTQPECDACIEVGRCCSPYGKPGDLLWVRETTHILDGRGNGRPIELWDAYITYQADDAQTAILGLNMDLWRESYDSDQIKFTPSIFMPRWASRITLEILSVRVERLRDMSEEDAAAEGVDVPSCDACGYTYRDCQLHADHHLCGQMRPQSAVAAFASVWESINGKKFPWESSPWVWVLEFKRA